MSIASVLVAIGGVWLVSLQLKHGASALRSQAASSDIASVLAIWQRLDEHWNRFRNADQERKAFEFGQLISYYEMACSLFRDRVFTTRATRTLHEHLHEILPAMQREPTFQALLDQLVTDEATFENIKWFCKQPAPRRAAQVSS